MQTRELERWLIARTELIVTARQMRQRKVRFEMERLKEKLAQAAGVAPRATAKIEAEADRLIARGPEIDQKTNEAFAPHHALLDSHNRDLDQLEDALKIVSNADPLESSSPAFAEATAGMGDSEDGQERHTPVPPLTLPDQPNNAPTATAPIRGTYRAEAEQQIAARKP